MATAVADTEDGAVIRPLRVLTALIKEELHLAEQAGMPHVRKAAALLIEVRDAHYQGRVEDFYKWADSEFNRSKATLRRWINLVSDETKSRRRFESLREQQRHRGHITPTSGRSFRKPDWHEAVDDSAERARREMNRIRDIELTRQQERDADHKLALRLIDIGYKVLAKELHSDKGGPPGAMTRLNRVRDRLKGCA